MANVLDGTELGWQMVSRHYEIWHLVWMAEVLGGKCSGGKIAGDS